MIEDLNERQEARKQRKANPDAWRLPQGESSSKLEGGEVGDDTAKTDQFTDLTVEQLREWATANGATIPDNKKLKADILEYLRNFAAYKAANGGQNPTPAWAGNN